MKITKEKQSSSSNKGTERENQVSLMLLEARDPVLDGMYQFAQSLAKFT